ncbi:MAG: cobalamin-binding protein [Gemmatimonadetes bacterium]|nr:MAG: cobalamin-binding protein [Gemmatimonadota bacterium]
MKGCASLWRKAFNRCNQLESETSCPFVTALKEQLQHRLADLEAGIDPLPALATFGQQVITESWFDFGLDRTDAIGTVHPRAEQPPRIACLVPSITELLFDLGLGDQLVARTSFCIHPADQVNAVPSVGGTKKINPHKLKITNPTHVIVNIDENPKEMVDQIAEFVPNVIVTHPNTPLDNLDLYLLIGSIFGKELEAGALCRQFEKTYQDLITTQVNYPPQQVLYLIWKNPWMTVSRQTYISECLKLIHWKTVGHDPDVRYPQIEIEPILDSTDLILFSSEPYPFTSADITEFRTHYPVEQKTTVLIDGEMISWYGSRAIQGLRYLKQMATTLFLAEEEQ